MDPPLSLVASKSTNSDLGKGVYQHKSGPPTKATDRPVEPTSTQVSVTIERSVHFDHVCEDIAEAEGDEGMKGHGSSEEGIERDMAWSL